MKVLNSGLDRFFSRPWKLLIAIKVRKILTWIFPKEPPTRRYSWLEARLLEARIHCSKIPLQSRFLQQSGIEIWRIPAGLSNATFILNEQKQFQPFGRWEARISHLLRVLIVEIEVPCQRLGQRWMLFDCLKKCLFFQMTSCNWRFNKKDQIRGSEINIWENLENEKFSFYLQKCKLYSR